MNSDDFIADLIENRSLILAASGLSETDALLKIVSYLSRLRTKETKVISLVGGAASGKTNIAKEIAEKLKSTNVIGTDDFVLGTKKFRREYLELEGKNPLMKYGFDFLRDKVEQIKNLDFDELVCLPLYQSRSGTGLQIKYNKKTGQVIAINENYCRRRIGRADYLIVEGDFQVLQSPD